MCVVVEDISRHENGAWQVMRRKPAPGNRRAVSEGARPVLGRRSWQRAGYAQAYCAADEGTVLPPDWLP